MYRICTFTVTMFWGLLAHGHHSILSIYDESNRITVEVVVKDFRFIRPHPLIIVEIINPSENRLVDSIGAREQLTLEMDNMMELAELGFTDNTLISGDRIVVTVDPSRYTPNVMYVRTLEHQTDGYRYEHNKKRLFYL